MYVGANKVIGMALGSQSGAKMLKLGEAHMWGREYTLTKTLKGLTLDNADTAAIYGKRYTALMITSEGMQVIPSSVNVTMGGTDITSTSYDMETNTLDIPFITGAVTIKAEAATIPVGYEPMMYIETTTASAGSKIALPYFPNNNTELELDVKLVDVVGFLYGTKSSGTVNASTTNFFAYIKSTTSSSPSGGFAFGHKSISGTTRPLSVTRRFTLKANKTSITYVRRGETTTRTASVSSTDTWAMSGGNNLYLFGRNSDNYYGAGRIYRCIISESGTVLQDYIPVKILSSGNAGLYDVANQSVIVASSFSFPT